MFDKVTIDLATRVIQQAARQGIKIATVESCTGGLIGGALTAVSGSSDVVDRGFITYSNDAKMEMVNVPDHLLTRVGAVSRETAEAMAIGGLRNSRAQIAVSVTGVAGPSGGSLAKPVGTVWFGLAQTGKKTRSFLGQFGNYGRDDVRQKTIKQALHMILENLEQQS